MVLSLLASPEADLPKLAVMPLKANRVEKATVDVLDELVVNEVSRQGREKVISAADINAVLGFEKMKDAIGCDDLACAADIGGALGVDRLLAGSVNRLGEEMIVSLKIIDIHTQEIRGRVQETAPADESQYRKAIESAVAKLYGESADASPAPDAAVEKIPFLYEDDWREYEKYSRTVSAAFALTPLEWARRRNEESTALFIGELASGGVFLLGFLLGVVGENTNNSDMEEGGVLIIPGGIGLATTLIIDLLDIGQVELRAEAKGGADGA